MKNIYKYLIGGLSILGLASCQKVIDIDLKDAAQVYIVDALLTDELGTNYVKITQSKSFYQDNNFPSIADALVIISTPTSTDTLLYDQNLGYYTAPNFIATGNTIYDLEIIINDDTLRSSNELPERKVYIDSFKVVKSEFSFFEDIYTAVPYYTDPVGRGDYYLLQGYWNGIKSTSLETDNDEFIDGQLNQSSISVRKRALDDDDPEFNNGDTLTVELMCVTKPAYTFYSTLQLNSSAFAGNPANPTSNVKSSKGNVIGVFTIATIDRKTIIAEY